ncbi:MAG: hypothetical protein II942_02970 [Alphaproteobacteria bacterium]|nr:hypothetical protein [Alphaproteobacteria bacterium]
MAYSIREQYELLKQYLDMMRDYNTEEVREALGARAPSAEYIERCEQELARLKDLLQQESAPKLPAFDPMDLSRAQQMTLDLLPSDATPAPAPQPVPQKRKTKPAKKKASIKAALPKAPAQTTQQALKTTTALTPSAFVIDQVHHRTQPSIRLTKKSKYHIDWNYYENMLKLFAFIQLYKGELTPQQQLDKDALTQAIECQGNARSGLKRRLSAAQLMTREVQTSRGARPYLAQGENVILALVKQEKSKTEKDPFKADKYRRDSASLLRVLDEITLESENAWDQAQRRNITGMAHDVFRAVRDAYKTK